MRQGAGAGNRSWASARRLRNGRRLRLARIPPALRRRPRQWAMESRTVRHRARVRPAAARPRDRGVAAGDAGRAAKRHRGGRDDSRRAGAAQCHPRCHRPPLPIPAGDPNHAQGSARVTTLSLTINGRAHGPIEVRDELTMNDFLREVLGMTGTKFGCGAAQCLSCAVIVDNPDGTSYTSPTCVVPAANFNGKAVRTVEGHARNGELSALQKAFVDHFAFQCGYCTAGFLNEGQVLLERLARKPVVRADLEKVIAEALDGHLCRCTGYIKYHEAVRDVILADAKRYLVNA